MREWNKGVVKVDANLSFFFQVCSAEYNKEKQYWNKS